MLRWMTRTKVEFATDESDRSSTLETIETSVAKTGSGLHGIYSKLLLLSLILPHCEFVHTWFIWHTLLHFPQLRGSDTNTWEATHCELQTTSPNGHSHFPELQVYKLDSQLANLIWKTNIVTTSAMTFVRGSISANIITRAETFWTFTLTSFTELIFRANISTMTTIVIVWAKRRTSVCAEFEPNVTWATSQDTALNC